MGLKVYERIKVGLPGVFEAIEEEEAMLALIDRKAGSLNLTGGGTPKDGQPVDGLTREYILGRLAGLEWALAILGQEATNGNQTNDGR